jgi:hypothetical protein
VKCIPETCRTPRTMVLCAISNENERQRDRAPVMRPAWTVPGIGGTREHTTAPQQPERS